MEVVHQPTIGYTDLGTDSFKKCLEFGWQGDIVYRIQWGDFVLEPFFHKMDTATVMQNFSPIHYIYCCEVMKNQKCLIFAKSSERFVNC